LRHLLIQGVEIEIRQQRADDASHTIDNSARRMGRMSLPLESSV
jgi:hypothetical protein